MIGSNPHSYWAIRLWGFEFWDSTKYLSSHIKEIRAIGQINPLRISLRKIRSLLNRGLKCLHCVVVNYAYIVFGRD